MANEPIPGPSWRQDPYFPEDQKSTSDQDGAKLDKGLFRKMLNCAYDIGKKFARPWKSLKRNSREADIEESSQLNKKRKKDHSYDDDEHVSCRSEIEKLKAQITALEGRLKIAEEEKNILKAIYPATLKFVKDSRLDLVKLTEAFVLILDTNVMLGSLNMVKQLETITIEGKLVFIAFAYEILNELDGLKKDPKVGSNAQRAIKFIREKETSFRYHHQTSYQAAQCATKFTEAGDNKFLEFALDLANNVGAEAVFLVSNDINVYNKANSWKLFKIDWQVFKVKLQNKTVFTFAEFIEQ